MMPNPPAQGPGDALRCEICENGEGNRTQVAREMMFGMGGAFRYLECAGCGCLQLLDVPRDLSRFYPANYYSFGDRAVGRDGALRRFLKRRRVSYCLRGRDPLGRLLSARYGTPGFIKWLKVAKVGLDSEIIDVGCGTGRLLLEMAGEGFSNLRGIDPYIERDIIYPNGVRVLRKGLGEVDGEFDFAMLHHSFEHMAGPLSALKRLNALLRPGRFALIRVPVARSHAWKKYGVNWVQLDAPRHLFLHTENSMRILAGKAGFELRETVYDSTAFQFWGSEQYVRGIPLRDPRSHGENPGGSMFPKERIDEFERMAGDLNAKGEGDSASFYLRKA